MQVWIYYLLLSFIQMLFLIYMNMKFVFELMVIDFIQNTVYQHLSNKSSDLYSAVYVFHWIIQNILLSDSISYHVLTFKYLSDLWGYLTSSIFNVSENNY